LSKSKGSFVGDRIELQSSGSHNLLLINDIKAVIVLIILIHLRLVRPRLQGIDLVIPHLLGRLGNPRCGFTGSDTNKLRFGEVVALMMLQRWTLVLPFILLYPLLTLSNFLLDTFLHVHFLFAFVIRSCLDVVILEVPEGRTESGTALLEIVEVALASAFLVGGVVLLMAAERGEATRVGGGGN
jgi:hypothetical protein